MSQGPLIHRLIRPARGLCGSVLVCVSLCGLAACADANVDGSKGLVPTPTVAASQLDQPVVPAVDSATAVVLDVTSSTRTDYLTGTEAIVAEALDRWPQAGRGGIELAVTLINSYSYDPVNEILVGRVDGLPPVPSLRATKPRPAQPDLTPCKANAFSRVKCEEGLVNDYNSALAAAIEDEHAAAAEHELAVETQSALGQQRTAEMKSLTDQLRNLRPKTDTTASDISGGILRAAEFLNASTAPHKKLIIQSDLEPSGPQQQGALQLRGFDVIIVFWDCRENRSCAVRKDDATQRFTAAGAASVVFYDPASSRLLTNVLGGRK